MQTLAILIPYFEALLGGLIPIAVWLWFWEEEDWRHPEPKTLIVLAFMAGMVGTILVIPFEKYIRLAIEGASAYISNAQPTPQTIVAWAAIEESTKLLMAWLVVLWRRANDEPLDSVIYMITVALGFSALENAIFILPYLLGDQSGTAFAVANIRFIGATLIHTLSSGVIGIFLALAFYKSRAAKFIYLVAGLTVAVILHSLFNLSIISGNENVSVLPFFAVWIGIVTLLLFLERIKHIPKPVVKINK
jgi:RsiW-degrading membrane proteinase PrsW (M82 family)